MKKKLFLTVYSFFTIFASGQGLLDTSFDPEAGPNDFVRTTAIQSDGKTIIGGDFTSYNGQSVNHIARLNSDGTLDTTFTTGIGTNGGVLSTAIQPDGKIIIGGNFTSYNGTTSNFIARLNNNGTLDTTFNSGSGSNNSVHTIVIQSDGKIIIGGFFTAYNGTARKCIARLNTDGTLDTTFTPGTGASSTVRAVAIQSDGKIIIGGLFTSYNGTDVNYIARLNVNGTLDTTFAVGMGTSGPVFTTAIQSDGKIIIGGSFVTFDGANASRVARLNDNGTLDTTFISGTAANGFLNTTAIQSDGKIVIGGFFTSYSGSFSNKIARLNANGTLDTSFYTGVGFGVGVVNTAAIQLDGKIIIGGGFIEYDGLVRNQIARLNNAITLGIKDQAISDENVVIYKDGNNLHIQAVKNAMRAVRIYDITGREMYTYKNINNTELVVDNLKTNEQILIVKITDNNNLELNRKIVF